ncbi:MAG: S8 family serine peptidase, partial [Bacteroidota bacterium]
MPKDWYLRDWQDDHQQGLSVEKTYATLLKDKPSRTVLVAVIDSGVDTDHEDLKDVIWSNEDEVADNGIDDDNNGYIDDVHGWSFIGGKNGSVVEDTYELTREYVRLKGIYGRPGERKARKKNAVEFEYWRKIKQEFEKSSTLYNNLYATFQKRYVDAGLANDTVKKILKVEKLKAEHLSQLNVKGAFLKTATETLAAAFKTFGDVDRALAEWKAIVNFFEYKSKYGYNVGFDPRTIVGDNYSDVYEKNYGSNDVKGPDPDHGTHVAGIIGANRNNNIGIKGIANNIRIMVLRAVPHGDERDKDVANAIIYAVDNGAKVINMSFGKYYSPQKDAVDKSVKYAESKDVLIIHAAGNDRTDNDIHGS